MKFTPKSFLSVLTSSFLLLPIAPVIAADNSTYQSGVLTIPSIDTPEQVGQYLNATLSLAPNSTWILSNYDVLGAKGLVFAPTTQVDVVTTSSFPVQVLLKVSGSFPNGCGTLGTTHQRLVGNRFDVSLTASYPYPLNLLCTQIVREFVKTIPLPVYGLAAGTYTYNVNGLTGSFTLAADNTLAGDCDGAAAVPCQK